MAKLLIGGNIVEIPTPLNFKKIKRVWPYLQIAAKAEQGNEEDALEVFNHSLSIFSIALEGTPNAMSVDEMEDKLLGNELMPMQNTLKELIKESGLSVEQKSVSGNVEPGPENRSTETATQ